MVRCRLKGREAHRPVTPLRATDIVTSHGKVHFCLASAVKTILVGLVRIQTTVLEVLKYKQ